MTTSCRSFSSRDVQRPADVRQRRDHCVDGEGVERHQPGEHRRHLARAGALHAVVESRIRTWERACWPIARRRATVARAKKGVEMMQRRRLRRRSFLQGARRAGGRDDAAARAASWPQAAAELPPIPLPPPITSAERLQRLAKARALMQQNGIGAIIVEVRPEPRLFHRRPMVAVRAADRRRSSRRRATRSSSRPSSSARRSPKCSSIPAEIRTWNEDEEPLKLVADFLRERGVAGAADRVRGDRPLLHLRPAEAAAARRARSSAPIRSFARCG